MYLDSYKKSINRCNNLSNIYLFCCIYSETKCLLTFLWLAFMVILVKWLKLILHWWYFPDNHCIQSHDQIYAQMTKNQPEVSWAWLVILLITVNAKCTQKVCHSKLCSGRNFDALLDPLWVKIECWYFLTFPNYTYRLV